MTLINHPLFWRTGCGYERPLFIGWMDIEHRVESLNYTVAYFYEECWKYTQDQGRGWGRKRAQAHIAEVDTDMETYVLPLIGDVLLMDLTTDHIRLVKESLDSDDRWWSTLGTLSRMIEYAVGDPYRVPLGMRQYELRACLACGPGDRYRRAENPICGSKRCCEYVPPLREHISLALRNEVIARDGRRCYLCGTNCEEIHIDHVHPVAKGGRSVLENLKVACPTCNMSKGDKLLAEFLAA